MKRCLVIAVLLTLTLASGSVFAKGNAFGIRAGGGFSFAAGPGLDSLFVVSEEDRTAKFSGAFGLYLDRWFSARVGLEIGAGIQSQGARWKRGDSFVEVQHLYLEVPVLARINIKDFQIGVGLAMFFALWGQRTLDSPEYSEEVTWGDERWDVYHRVNFGPKIYAGYRFHTGPVSIVPSLSWSFHFINDVDRNEMEEREPDADLDSYRTRYNNLLLNVGLEVPF